MCELRLRTGIDLEAVDGAATPYMKHLIWKGFPESLCRNPNS
jgi:hypothetical protein